MTLYLHIGLPKTATTYWQKSIFPQIDGIKYSSAMDAPNDNLSPAIKLKRFFTGRATNNGAALHDIVQRVHSLGQLGQCDILISQENYSVAPNGFWKGKGPDPKEFCLRLDKLICALGSPQVRLLFGTRNVDDWLASRYAQSARSMENPSQTDFDKHIERICRSNGVNGPYLWLKFEYVERVLKEAVGSENVCVMPMEKLQMQTEQEILRIGRFIGNRDLSPLLKKMESDKSFLTKRNVRSTEKNTWELNGSDNSITLSASQRGDIERVFSTDIPAH